MLKMVATIGMALIMFLPGKKVAVWNMEQLQAAAAQKNNDTLYVVNFWATWCKPCVNEMPFFEKAAGHFASEKVKVVFVSMNSAKELVLVEKFVADKQVKNDVAILSAGNPNNWIDKVDSSWSGAIPATIMYRKGRKVFFREGEFTQNQLDSIIQLKIKQP